MTADGQRALDDHDQMAEVYADDADRHPVNCSYERPAMLGMAGELGGRRVLDVGCAAGALSAAMVARGASVVGVDGNEPLVERARQRLWDRARFHVADLVEPLEFLPDASFDVVTASLVLTDTWRKGGREFQVRFYHRPLSAICDALADAGFLIERIVEPVPDREAFADEPAFYQRMMRSPWFLFIRAITWPGV